jgi:CBS domain-containing protein
MTAEVVTVDSGVSVQDCMAIMTQKKCRHLPVVDEGKVQGVVSIGDCVKEISKEAQARIQDLTAYITGTDPA